MHNFPPALTKRDRQPDKLIYAQAAAHRLAHSTTDCPAADGKGGRDSAAAPKPAMPSFNRLQLSAGYAALIGCDSARRHMTRQAFSWHFLSKKRRMRQKEMAITLTPGSPSHSNVNHGHIDFRQQTRGEIAILVVTDLVALDR